MNPYHFEQTEPPVLTESMLRETEHRRTGRITLALLMLSGVLMQTAVVLLGLYAEPVYPIFSWCCFFYVIFSTAVCTLFAGVFAYKGGFLSCC